MVENKDYYRKLVRNLRNELTPNEKVEFDNEITKKVLDSEIFKNSLNIFTYISYKKEVDTLDIIKKSLNLNKRIVVPKIISLEKGMNVIEISSFENLKENYMGILEPENDDIFKDKIHLAIMPGVAFSKNGGRIGYGGGFYDRYLSNLDYNVVKISLAYSFQIFDEVPMDENDVYIDYIITEKGVIRRT